MNTYTLQLINGEDLCRIKSYEEYGPGERIFAGGYFLYIQGIDFNTNTLFVEIQ
jgi:hypothetical protein